MNNSSMSGACYRCIYRGSVPGDTHSCCRYPGNETDLIMGLINQANVSNALRLKIRGVIHGIESGWFFWPVNFDPVWLANCDGFTPKEDALGG